MQTTRPSNYTPDEVLEDLTGKGRHLDQENIREHIRESCDGDGAALDWFELCRQIAGFCPLALVASIQAETPLLNWAWNWRKVQNAVFNQRSGTSRGSTM